MRKLLFAIALPAIALATPASAKKPDAGENACSITSPNPDAVDCSGFFSGNLLNNANNTAIKTDIGTLSNGGYTASFTGTFAGLAAGNVVTSLSNVSNGMGTLSFGQMLMGETVIGLHYGGGTNSPAGSEGTEFLLFDFTSPVSSIQVDANSFSNAALFYTGAHGSVPEPATWAMMLIGFGAIGFATRRNRKPVMAQIA